MRKQNMKQQKQFFLNKARGIKERLKWHGNEE